MRIPIEETGPLQDYPGAEPGVYHMTVVKWRQDVETKYGFRDVIDFCGDDPADGHTCGATLWLRGPSRKDDGTPTKGNLWYYRVLAEALGAEALLQYRTPEADGGSSFKPTDWRGIHVKVTVGANSNVDDVAPADLEWLKRQKEASRPIADVGDPHNLDDGRHDSGANDDDIPF